MNPPSDNRSAPHGVLREAVGIFHDKSALQNAVDRLESANFDRMDLSVLAPEAAIGGKLVDIRSKEDDPDAPRGVLVEPEELAEAETSLVGGFAYVGAVAAAGTLAASGGTLLGAYLAAAMAGTASGLIGSILARWVGEHEAEKLARQLDRGGLILWVHCRDAAHETRASAILRECGAEDVHVHGFAIPSYVERSGGKISFFEQALLDPLSVFAEPADVVTSPSLDMAQKIEVLHRWALDARQLETAESEGMQGGEPDRMGAVTDALRRLEDG